MSADPAPAREGLMADVSTELKVIKWMLGALYAPVFAILLKLFLG